MKHMKGHASIGLLAVLIPLFFVGCWVVNAIKLVECDFESPYKCEAVHAVGLLGVPLSTITVWFDPEEEKL